MKTCKSPELWTIFNVAIGNCALFIPAAPRYEDAKTP